MNSISKFVNESVNVRRNQGSGYISRLFEGIQGELPVQPDSTPWERARSGDEIRFKAQFSNREKLKDFVSSIQELEDRMNHYVSISISGGEVTIEEEISSISAIDSSSKRFFETLQSIKETFGGR